jgi:DNA-3-methyladenine glycosylase
MGRIVQAKAWGGRNTVALARGLLGRRLVRARPDGRREAWRITEVEAYHGESDLACHASKGRTPRTEVLYGRSGVWYVYLCYGIHEMLNLVVGPPGHPAAILIRGVEGISGPGRVTRALGIGRALNGRPAARA